MGCPADLGRPNMESSLMNHPTYKTEEEREVFHREVGRIRSFAVRPYIVLLEEGSQELADLFAYVLHQKALGNYKLLKI